MMGRGVSYGPSKTTTGPYPFIRRAVVLMIVVVCLQTGQDSHRMNLTMLIDRDGDGRWDVASSWLAATGGGMGAAPFWKTYSTATTLDFSGAAVAAGVVVARFAVVVEASNPRPLSLDDVVVAPIGVAMSTLPEVQELG